MRTLLSALFVLAAGLALAVEPAGAQEDTTVGAAAPVDVVEVTGLLDPIVAEFIVESIHDAEEAGSQALVLQMNTRAATADDEHLVDVMEAMQSSPLPIGIWVGPSGGRATGRAGQLLAAADITGLAPGTRIGDFDDALRDLGRLASLDDTTVRASDALSRQLVDIDAPVLGDFLVSLDGKVLKGVTLQTSEVIQSEDGPRRQPIAQARFHKLGLVQRLLHTAASPPVAYLLLSIGLAMLVFEFYTAGIGIAGVCGAVCIVLAGYGLATLPIRGWSLALILFSMFGFAVDVQTGVPRVWTAIALVAYVIASLTLFREGLSVSWITLVAGIGGMVLAYLIGMPTMVRTRFATPTIGREWMIGEIGDAIDDVAPDGTVRVRDALWPAHTNRATPIRAGARLRVVAIDGPVLEVEPEEGGAKDYRERRAKS